MLRKSLAERACVCVCVVLDFCAPGGIPWIFAIKKLIAFELAGQVARRITFYVRGRWQNLNVPITRVRKRAKQTGNAIRLAACPANSNAISFNDAACSGA